LPATASAAPISEADFVNKLLQWIYDYNEFIRRALEQAATMPRVVCVPISETALRVDQSGNIVPPSKVIFNDAL
jgi:hypothetical protein